MRYPEIREVLPCPGCVDRGLADKITIVERLAQAAGLSRQCVQPPLRVVFDPPIHDISGKMIVAAEICREGVAEDILIYGSAPLSENLGIQE